MSTPDEGDTNIETRSIPDGDGVLEVSVAPAPRAAREQWTIGAAHPAEAFGGETAALLRRAAGTAVVCVNPRGLGRSAPAAGPPALEAMADDVEAARARLGLPPWVFWGMSGGGWLGLLAARRHPRSLAGVILESTCACFRERLADPACLLSPFHPAWQAALAARGLLSARSHDEVGDPAATQWIDVPGAGAVFRRRGGPALLVSPVPLAPEMLRAMPALWAFDARPWLAEIRVPALVVAGTADPVLPTSRARALADGIAGAELVAIEGAGHVPISQAHPAAAEAVRRFLARLPQG